jgi:PAS domain-containing protein
MHVIGDEIERITGYPADDFIDNRRRTYGSVIHPDDRRNVERSVWEAVESDRQFEIEYRVITASGEDQERSRRGDARCGAHSSAAGQRLALIAASASASRGDRSRAAL